MKYMSLSQFLILGMFYHQVHSDIYLHNPRYGNNWINVYYAVGL